MSKKLLKKYKEIEAAKAFLKANGYFTDNLWCVDDVKGKFNCNDEEAQGVLNQSLTNDATMEQIWLSIGIFGDMNGLTPKETAE